MCGIFGQWDTAGRAVNVAHVRSATTTLRHRGPDDEGFLLASTRAGRYVHCGGRDTPASIPGPRIDSVLDDSFDLALGFRRLSILDLSPAGHQPMPSGDGRLCIVFNGEIYNYRELRDELAALGHRFKGASDTEVLLAAYERWGADCLHRLNGMWAFAVWDRQDRTLFLARDRFGVKPLHYVWRDGRFAFASEIKALVGPHGVPFVANEEAVYRYLLAGHLPSPQGGDTFFAGVHAVPPGHCVRVTGGGVELRRYYRLPEPRDEPAACTARTVEEYRELFIDAVRLRLRADVPIGSCLSGGVDSSSIVCVVNRLMRDDGVAASQIGERQKTFSAVYDSRGAYDESAHIEVVIGATGAERNYTIPTAERLRADLPRLVWHQDEPFPTTSMFAQWCVMAKARERGVTVLLDGQGADEALAGYRPFDIFLADMVRRRRYAGALAAGREIRATTGLRAAPLLARALLRQLPARGLDHLRAKRAVAATRAMSRDFAAAYDPAPRYRPVNRSMSAYLRELFDETSIPHLLRYEDRNSMAFSVEGRVPFLDYRLVEFSLTRAHACCIRDGWTKWVLREAMSGLVPHEIAWRRDKVGFETPERDWLGTWFAQPASLPGADSPIARYLDVAAVRREIAAWQRGGGDSRQVWRWLNLDLWLRTFS